MGILKSRSILIYFLRNKIFFLQCNQWGDARRTSHLEAVIEGNGYRRLSRFLEKNELFSTESSDDTW